MQLAGNRYQISEPIPIAETNDSVLFLGRQTALKRRVVLKRKKSDTGRKEAIRTSRIDHPNIVKVIEVLPEERTIVLECVRGVPLAHLDFEEDFADDRERLECAIDIAAGLQAIHRAGEIHGDFSWNNILYDTENRCPKIIDFGVNGSDWCSPSTTAPEHAPNHSREIGPYTDVYDFGLILKKLLPKSGKIVKLCLRKNPEKRASIDKILVMLTAERRRNGVLAPILATAGLIGMSVAIWFNAPAVEKRAEPAAIEESAMMAEESGQAQYGGRVKKLVEFPDETLSIINDTP